MYIHFCIVCKPLLSTLVNHCSMYLLLTVIYRSGQYTPKPQLFMKIKVGNREQTFSVPRLETPMYTLCWICNLWQLGCMAEDRMMATFKHSNITFRAITIALKKGKMWYPATSINSWRSFTYRAFLLLNVTTCKSLVIQIFLIHTCIMHWTQSFETGGYFDYQIKWGSLSIHLKTIIRWECEKNE